MACFNKGHRRVRRLGLGGDILGGALSGAGAGATFGPLGAGIGAVIGAGGAFIKNKKQEELKQEAARRRTVTQEAGDYFSDLSYLQAFDNQFNAANGVDMAQIGQPTLNQGFLIDENPTRLASDVVKINGNDHSNGGVNVDADLDGFSEIELEGGEVAKEKRVFSKRLKVPMEFIDMAREEGFTVTRGSYAKIAESLGRSKNKYEQKLDTIDHIEANTAFLMLNRIEDLFDNLFYTQEFSNLSKTS